MPHRVQSWLVVALALSLGSVAPLVAQVTEVAARGPRFFSATSPTPMPLDVRQVVVLQRRVSLDLADATLGQALAELTQQSGLRFTYSKDVITLDSRVQLQAQSITVAAALAALLVDARVDVVLTSNGQAILTRQASANGVAVQRGAVTGRVTDAKTRLVLAGATIVLDGTRHSVTSTGNDGRYRITDVAPGTYTVRARYIGYTPGTASVTVSADQEATADLALEKSAQRLDEVVTTGTVVPTEVKALPTPISVVTAEDIQHQNLQRVDEVFRGQVPGIIALEKGPGLDRSGYELALRGASTIVAATTVKTFIDGVEVADPSYLASIDPNSVERIEITRGPQASTMYGAGALDGVMQVFTKKGELGLTRPEVTAKLSAGSIGGFDGQSTAYQTDNTASVFGGAGKSSYSLGGSYGHVGDWVPRYTSTDWGVTAGGQTRQGPLSLSSSLRYADKTNDDPFDTRLASYTFFSKPTYLAKHLRQQTYGLTATLQASRNWQHSLTVGYDQTYDASTQTQPRFTTPDDSLLSAFAVHEAKTSLLYHTDLLLRLGNALAATVTLGVNHDAYDFQYAATVGATHTTGSLDGTSYVVRTPWTNTGYFGQLQINVVERLFLTGGVRAERNGNFGADFGTAWSPRVGAAYLLGLGPTTVKLRASYGESIRAPDPEQRDGFQQPTFQVLANPKLAPERQHGADGGMDIYLGRISLGVTYYNQRVIDLIYGVTLPPQNSLFTSQYENIGRIKNEGWEFEAHLPLGPVQLAGTYSIMNSTIQQISPDFVSAGSYMVGDRVQNVPHTSGGLTIAYAPLRATRVTATMTYIGHWTSIDAAAEYAAFYGSDPYRGTERAYWIEYPAVTKFAVGVSQELTKNLGGFVRAENVGNNLRYETTNLNIPTPRRVIVGANIRY